MGIVAATVMKFNFKKNGDVIGSKNSAMSKPMKKMVRQLETTRS